MVARALVVDPNYITRAMVTLAITLCNVCAPPRGDSFMISVSSRPERQHEEGEGLVASQHFTRRPAPSPARALAASALTISVAISLATALASVAADAPIYKDPHAPVDARVNDLLSRMTLQEKIAQLSCIWQRKGEVEDASGNFDPAKASHVFPYGIGQVARPSDRVPLEANDPLQNVFRNAPQTVDFVNAVQHYSVDDTRLGIPTLFHGEGLHGYMARDATSFPQAIALASSWDPALLTQVYTVVAREARARGVQLLLTPVINLGRDPRWGRIEETFGEDPYIASRMGIAEVRGLQGDTLPLSPGHVFATLKHMAAYGVPEAGTNVGPAEISQRTLLQMYLPQFHAAIQQANAQVVMASYNEIGGIPSHANRWMLTDLLRDQWGFKGRRGCRLRGHRAAHVPAPRGRQPDRCGRPRAACRRRR